MFCMNCGQQLPDGAKFCLNCGTPQGAVSPTGTLQTETINLDGMHTFVPAMCPNCNAHMKVDTSSKVARCETCGTECLVQDAIKALTVRGNVKVGSATINVTGTNTDSLLKRVEIMLESGDFEGVKSKCDTLLDLDPTNGKIYFYLLLAEMRCRNRNELVKFSWFQPLDRKDYYSKAMKYGDPELKKELQGYTDKYYATKYDANLKNPQDGHLIRFGSNEYGQFAIWEILKIQDNKLLVIWHDEPIFAPYHNRLEDITWEDCTLRKWLNNEFIQSHFTPAEQKRILPCVHNNVKNPNAAEGNRFPRSFAGKNNDSKNSENETPEGVATTDKVFLLSENELKELSSKRTGHFLLYYTSSRGTLNSGNRWWLRLPTKDTKATYVAYDEYDNYYTTSDRVDKCHDVRPALWLNLNSSNQ